jgi:type I restriction enzyme R subunit
MRLSSAFLLVKHLGDCRGFADEIIFYQRVRKQIAKTASGNRKLRQLEQAVRDLVDDSVESTGVVDIFKVAGLEKADISILDDRFLQTFKDRPYENLRLKLLEQLLQDELRLREKSNLAKYRSFREMLEATLRKYHNRLIDAAAVIKVMLKIREEELREQQRASELNLAPEEVAFYDAVADNLAEIYDQEFLTGLIHDVAQAVKRNLKVDWTEPHRDAVKAEVRAAVRRVLRARGVRREHFDLLVDRIMEQAAALYASWPSAA